MTWKHVALIVIGGLVMIAGAFIKDEQTRNGGMMIIAGALGHAGAGGRATDQKGQTERRIL